MTSWEQRRDAFIARKEKAEPGFRKQVAARVRARELAKKAAEGQQKKGRVAE